MKRVPYCIAGIATILGLGLTSLIAPQAAQAHWYCDAHPHPHPGPGGLACIPKPQKKGPSPFLGGFFGSMTGTILNNAIQSKPSEKTTVIYQQPPTQVVSPPIGATATVSAMGQQVLQRNGLMGVSCVPGTVVIKLPTSEAVCAYPTSHVPAGFYEIHPQTWQVINVGYSQ